VLLRKLRELRLLDCADPWRWDEGWPGLEKRVGDMGAEGMPESDCEAECPGAE
jgi:hypothetical protein